MGIEIKLKGINKKRKEELGPVAGRYSSIGPALVRLSRINIKLEKIDKDHRYMIFGEEIWIRKKGNHTPILPMANMYLI